MRSFLNYINQLRDFLGRRSAAATTGIVLAAALALVAHAMWRPATDAGPDGETYWRLGVAAAAAPSLAACGNFRRSYWSPGWVMTLGAMHRAGATGPLAVRLALIATAIATAWLVWLMARRLAGGCAAAVAVGLFLFSTLVFRYTVYYQYEIPLAFFIALSGYLLPFASGRLKMAVAGAVAAGFALGLAALISPRALVLAPLLSVCAARSHRWRRAALISLALLAGVAAVLTPWIARNHRCFDRWTITTNGGINLYIGNNPHATGGYHLPPPDLRPSHPFHDSSAWIGEAFRYAADHPLATVARSARKVLKFWNPHYGDQFLVLLLFVSGWVGLLRSRPAWSAGLLWVAAAPIVITLVHAVFFVQVRYMIPVLPMVVVVAGAGACGWRRRRSEEVT